MSKWRLVEAEVSERKVEGQSITDLRPTAHNPAFDQEDKKQIQTGGVRKRRSSRAYSGARDRSGTLDDYGLEEDDAYQQLSAEDLTYATHLACNNIEYLFSTDSLVVNGDLYLRSLMDCEGYVPLVYILQYPDLMYSVASADDIMAALAANSMCTLQVDTVNGTLRLKENWKAYLMPNNSGGMGLSQRWIKDVVDNGSVPVAGASSASAPIPIAGARAGAAGLSAGAREFVSSSPAAGSPLRPDAFTFVPK